MSRIALCQDYLAQMGGAERVLEVLHQTLPDADLYTTFAVPERLSQYLCETRPKTSWMQYLPAKSKLYRHYFLLYPLGIEAMHLDAYDLVVSSCCGYAKGIKRRQGAIHVCYCHNPMRWVWRFQDYMAKESFSRTTKAALDIVAERLRSAFGVHAEVIEPPIVTSRFKVRKDVEDYYLILSRLVPYKRIDLAIEACTRTGRRLMVIGDGPERARLESLAGPTVKFLGRQPDNVVNRHAGRCRALIFPGEEDFGMAPLEINAAGRPVIAYGAGGATETILENLNGVLFSEQTVESLIQALEKYESQTWDPIAIRQHAQRYDVKIFQQRVLDFLAQVSPVIRERQEAA
jgi:glycosyltransferase involved in cell wall biosynthesis